MSRYGTVTSPVGAHLADPGALSAFAGHCGGGVVVGLDRHRTPVVLRMFRPEPTRLAVIGALRCAQLLTVRAMAVGARVFVETGRPDAWADFGQRFALRGDGFSVGGVGAGAAGAASGKSGPASYDRPRLVVVDAGYPVAVASTGGWQATLVLREELTERDVDLFAADVAIVQRLSEAEAMIAARALPTPQVREWLPRIAPEMVAIVGGHGLRWALLSPTTIERRLLTSVARDGSPAPGAI